MLRFNFLTIGYIAALRKMRGCLHGFTSQELLILVIAIGVAVKLGVLDQIKDLARDAAVQSGVPQAQVDAATSTAFSSLSIGSIMTAIGTLPQPFGALGKLLFLLVLVAFVASIGGGLLAAIMRAIRWFRDSLV